APALVRARCPGWLGIPRKPARTPAHGPGVPQWARRGGGAVAHVTLGGGALPRAASALDREEAGRGEEERRTPRALSPGAHRACWRTRELAHPLRRRQRPTATQAG